MARDPRSTQEARRAARVAASAVHKARQTADTDPDRTAAVAALAELAEALRGLADDAADDRARTVAELIDSGAVTRADLAEALGLTRGRVDQLYRAGRTSGARGE